MHFDPPPYIYIDKIIIIKNNIGNIYNYWEI